MSDDDEGAFTEEEMAEAEGDYVASDDDMDDEDDEDIPLTNKRPRREDADESDDGSDQGDDEEEEAAPTVPPPPKGEGQHATTDQLLSLLGIPEEESLRPDNVAKLERARRVTYADGTTRVLKTERDLLILAGTLLSDVSNEHLNTPHQADHVLATLEETAPHVANRDEFIGVSVAIQDTVTYSLSAIIEDVYPYESAVMSDEKCPLCKSSMIMHLTQTRSIDEAGKWILICSKCRHVVS